MPQTLTEKLLARAAGRSSVEPGEIIIVEPHVAIIDVAHRLVGRNAIRDRAAGLGIGLPDESLRSVTDRVKSMADERQITLADVDRILSELMLPVDD